MKIPIYEKLEQKVYCLKFHEVMIGLSKYEMKEKYKDIQ